MASGHGKTALGMGWVVSDLFKYLNEPDKLLLVFAALIAVTLGAWLKDRLISEFDEMKLTVKEASHQIDQNTKILREKMMVYQMNMHELSGEVGKLRGQLLEDVRTLIHKFELIKSEVSRVEQSFKTSSETFQEQITFISNIRADLEKVYGSVERIDQNYDGLKITVVQHRETLDRIHQVLVAHNEKIKKIKE